MHIRQMDVPAQHHISPGSRPGAHGGLPIVEAVVFVLSPHDVNWLMNHHHAQLAGRLRAGLDELRGHPVDLRLRHVSIFVPPPAGGVHADHQTARCLHRGLQDRAKVGQVIFVGVQQPPGQVEQRDVVVARHHQLRRNVQALAKRAGLGKLVGLRALSDIARQHENCGVQSRGQTHQGIGHRGLHGAKVRV